MFLILIRPPRAKPRASGRTDGGPGRQARRFRSLPRKRRGWPGVTTKISGSLCRKCGCAKGRLYQCEPRFPPRWEVSASDPEASRHLRSGTITPATAGRHGAERKVGVRSRMDHSCRLAFLRDDNAEPASFAHFLSSFTRGAHWLLSTTYFRTDSPFCVFCASLWLEIHLLHKLQESSELSG